MIFLGQSLPWENWVEGWKAECGGWVHGFISVLFASLKILLTVEIEVRLG